MNVGHEALRALELRIHSYSISAFNEDERSFHLRTVLPPVRHTIYMFSGRLGENLRWSEKKN